MFGGSLLVAPVFNREGNATILLPAGKWYDFWNDRVLEGPMQIKENYPLNRFPLYVRGGAVIPLMRNEVQYIGSRPWGPLEIHVYGGDGGEFVVVGKFDGNVTILKIRHQKNDGVEEIIGEGKHDGILLVHHSKGNINKYDFAADDGFYFDLGKTAGSISLSSK